MANQNKKKRCHCTPFCTSIIGIRGRQQHYALLNDKASFAPSSSEDSESDSDHYQVPDHLSMLEALNSAHFSEINQDEDEQEPSISAALVSWYSNQRNSDASSKDDASASDSEVTEYADSDEEDEEWDQENTDIGQFYDDRYLQDLWAEEDHALRRYSHLSNCLIY